MMRSWCSFVAISELCRCARAFNTCSQDPRASDGFSYCFSNNIALATALLLNDMADKAPVRHFHMIKALMSIGIITFVSSSHAKSIMPCLLTDDCRLGMQQ